MSALPPTAEVIIVGAGVGGLATALALQRIGIRATILEQAAELREVGAGLLLTRNALSALSALGVRAEAEASGRLVRVWRILDRHGRVLQTFGGAGEAPRSLSIARSAFQQLLAKRVAPGCLRLGQAVVGAEISARGDRVMVRTSATTHEADLLLAADGAHSVVRRSLFSPAPARRLPYVGWRALVDHVPPSYGEGMISESWGEGCRYGIAPVSATRSYWYATENRVPDPALSPEARKRHLLARFGAWHDPIASLIAATPEESILLSDIAEHPPLRSWVRGPCASLGDAAHLMSPNLGQGAAMALEDACALAAALRDSAALPSALQRYERARAARVRAVVLLSRQVGRMIQLEHSWLTGLRDFSMRGMPDAVGRLALSPVFDFVVPAKLSHEGA